MRTGLLVPIVVLAAACQPANDVSVDHAWIRLAAVPGSPSAAYFTIEGGPKDETLTGVSSALAVRTEMHENKNEGGMMSMAPLKLVAVRAGSRETFAPNGRHVMLFGLDPAMTAGQQVPLTFTFASGRSVTTLAKVVAAGDSAPGE